LPESSALKDRHAPRLEELLGGLDRRLSTLGLTVSLWGPDGEELAAPSLRHEFCRRLCGERKVSEEDMRRLAQKVCLGKEPEVAKAPTGCCLVGVPVRRRRRLIGAAIGCFPTLQTPGSEELARACSQASLDGEFLSRLCEQVARHDSAEVELLCHVLELVIENEQAGDVAREELVTLSTNLASTYEELSLLYRISGSMKVTQSAADFFDNLCLELLEVMNLQVAAAVLYPRERGGSPDRVVMAGETPLDGREIRLLVEEHVVPRIGTNARAVVENQFHEEAGRPNPAFKGIRTLIAVPLMAAEHCKGVLLGLNKIGREFNSVDLKLISSIGSQAAVFLENHHLYEDLQDLLMGMLHALSASIDAKDPYTCGHSHRVALISRRLAELSGLDSERIERVYLAGLLHDIGKIGMPENVLHKAGRLTEMEYDEIKRHPEIGANILGGIRQMEDVIPAILSHHERPDGKGYPKGLAGGQVPFEALIVGLADSFDAMTSSRTYRSSMPLESVVAEIRRCSGTQFDSRLVELMLSIDLEGFLKEIREASTSAAQMAPRRQA